MERHLPSLSFHKIGSRPFLSWSGYRVFDRLKQTQFLYSTVQWDLLYDSQCGRSLLLVDFIANWFIYVLQTRAGHVRLVQKNWSWLSFQRRSHLSEEKLDECDMVAKVHLELVLANLVCLPPSILPLYLWDILAQSIRSRRDIRSPPSLFLWKMARRVQPKRPKLCGTYVGKTD